LVQHKEQKMEIRSLYWTNSLNTVATDFTVQLWYAVINSLLCTRQKKRMPLETLSVISIYNAVQQEGG
jgi:hypothetical protein